MKQDSIPFSTVTLSPAEDITAILQKFPEPGDVLLISSETSTPGGKGLNAARWLASRGHAVVASGLLGVDNAAPFEDLMARLGIRDFLVRIDGYSRHNAMFTAPGGMFKLNRVAFPDLREGEWSIDEILAPCMAHGGVCILAGSLPPPMPDDTYALMIRKLREAGIPAVLDTSGKALEAGVAAEPCLIKPNREECAELVGRVIENSNDFTEAVLSLLDKCECVIASDGPRGCWFGFRELLSKRVFHGSAAKVDVVDTTAAGDALLAEFCHRYFPARVIDESTMRYACAAGGAAITMPGAATPPMQLVDKLAAEIVITEVFFKS